MVFQNAGKDTSEDFYRANKDIVGHLKSKFIK